MAKDFGFNEGFSDSKKSKFLYNSDVFNAKVASGFLCLTHKIADKSYYLWEQSYLNWKQDFSISSAFKLVSGNNATYGILFGGNGNTSCSYVFIISDTGEFCFFKYINNEVKMIKDWTVSKNIKLSGQQNIIDVKNESGKYNFYINNKLAHSCNALPFFGFDVGYYISGKTIAISDYFNVFQKQTKPINLIQNSSNFGEKVNLGANINSYANEICPIITADEKKLFIARDGHLSNIGGKADDDIWFSEFNTKDSVWLPVKNIGRPLNNKDNNFIQAVSSDNNSVVLGNKYSSKGEYSGIGFSISFKTRDGWSIPKDLNIKNYYNDHVNNEVCLSPNGQVMLLAIQRDDTKGSKDLYVSFLQKDSSWTEPKNMGLVLNTFADETSPFIAADGVTMYFSTAGHPGLGNNDVFMTKRLDDTWLKWSEPQNLGPKINSTAWEAYYTIPASGHNAYIVADNTGNSDIYMLKQPESAKPEPVILIKGLVLNSETNKPLSASIHYCELGSKKILGNFKSDPRTGRFVVALPKGKKYSLIADKQNFISVHQNTDVINLKNYQEQEIDLLLTPIKKGQSVVINNLFFTADKAIILPESFPELDKIVEILKQNPKIKIIVSGHTSKNRSKVEWNLNLSTNRALAVKNYFIEKGISEKRITHIGYGSDKPLNNFTDEARLAKNRRVEFEIVEN